MKYYIYDNIQKKYFKQPRAGITEKRNKACEYTQEEVEEIFPYVKNSSYLELIEAKNTKILILGDARHGKDELARMICEKTGLTNKSSSVAALEIFLFDVLDKKYNLKYNSLEEAFEDRVNHRDIWYDEICLYNKEDKLNLVKGILRIADIYVGLRSDKEVEKAIEEKSFSHIIGVYNYGVQRESNSSNTADVLKYSDFIITNNGTLEDLENKVINIILKIIL